MDTEYQITRIEGYLAGSLTLEEKRQFEADLTIDAELRNLFAQHKFFLDGIQGMKMQKLRDSLKQSTTQQGSQRRIFRLVSIAAGILVLLCALYLLQRPGFSERLAVKYYALPLAELERSEESPEDLLIQTGMQAFEEEHWQDAITAFQRIETNNPRYVQAQYFRAHALIGSRRFSEALEVFSNLASETGPYQQQAQWNRVLAMLFMDMPMQSVIDGLAPIVNTPSHFYHTNAQLLQEELMPLKD